MWPGPNLVRFSHPVFRRSGLVIVRFALSGKAALGTLLCVVILLVFLRRSCQLLGHSRGECYLSDGLALVMLASYAEPRRLRRDAHQKSKKVLLRLRKDRTRGVLRR